MNKIKDIVRNLTSNTTSQIHAALLEIRTGFVRKTDKMKALEKYSVLKIVLSFIEHPKFCNISLSIVADACLEEMWALKFVENDAIKALTRIMKSLVNDGIKNRACRALGNILKFEIGYETIQWSDIIKHIIKFLFETEEFTCKQTAVRTLCILCKHSSCKEDIIRENGIFYIAQLLKSSNINVIPYCTRALAELTENCTRECVGQLLTLQTINIFVDLYTHYEEDTKTYIVKALQNLSNQDVARSFLIKAGVVKLFTEIITDSKSIEITKPAVLSLCNCLNYLHMWDNYGTSKRTGLKALVQALNISALKDVHLTIIASLLPLTFEQGIADVLIELGIIAILIQNLQIFITQHKIHHENYVALNECLNSEVTLSSSPVKKFQYNPSLNFEFDLPSTSKESVMMKEGLHGAGPSSTKDTNNVNTSYNNTVNSFYYPKNYYWNTHSTSSRYSPSSSSSNITISPKPNYGWPRSWSPLSETDEDESMRLSPTVSCASDNAEIADFVSTKIIPITMGNINFLPGTCDDKFKGNFSLNSCMERDTPHSTTVNTKPKISKLEKQEKVINKVNSEVEHINKKIKLSDSSDQKSNNHKISLLDSINKKEEQQAADHILSLLSQLSFHLEKKSNSELASKASFSVLMQYIFYIENVNPKAEKILLTLVKNRYCFEKLLRNGFVSEIEDIFNIMHDPKNCVHCSYMNSVYINLISAMHKEVESDYGIGTICHILYSTEKMCQVYAIHTVSKLVCAKTSLYKVFIQANGLELLFKFLNDTSEVISKRAIFCLCQSFQNLKKSSCDEFTNKCCIFQTCSLKLSKKCIYGEDVLDVNFIVDNGMVVSACRKKICSNSEYFHALLQGHFNETNQNSVRISGISAETLSTIFHFLHGCYKTEYCPYIEEIPFKVLLELLSNCEKFLLFEIKASIEDRLCHSMSLVTVLEIYKTAKIHNSPALYYKALYFILSLDVSLKDNLLHCFQNLLKIDNSFNVLNDCKIMFENKLKSFK